MEDIGEEYRLFWETNMLLHNEEFDSWGLDEALSAYYDSSSPDGATASKNIVSERNRRKKLNERLFALRAVVPNISKMDKASIIKDAIDYIRELHEEERRIQAEISELEQYYDKSKKLIPNSSSFKSNRISSPVRSKKKRTNSSSPSTTVSANTISSDGYNNHYRDRHNQFYDTRYPVDGSGGGYDNSNKETAGSSIEDLQLRVSYMGEKTVVVSLTCNKKAADAVVKLCEAFESLKLRIVTANITAFSGRLLKTVLIEADEEEKNHLKIRIEAALAALIDPEPMSM